MENYRIMGKRVLVLDNNSMCYFSGTVKLIKYHYGLFANKITYGIDVGDHIGKLDGDMPDYIETEQSERIFVQL